MAAIPEAVGLDSLATAAGIPLLWIPPYLFLGMRRFYEESRVRTLLKFGFVATTNFLLWALTVLGLLFVSLMTF